MSEQEDLRAGLPPWGSVVRAASECIQPSRCTPLVLHVWQTTPHGDGGKAVLRMNYPPFILYFRGLNHDDNNTVLYDNNIHLQCFSVVTSCALLLTEWLRPENSGLCR
jgi:hypothetical protein